MNYLILDLEMRKVPKHYRTKNYQHANEIIQIGAILLDENFEKIGTINQYVHPKYGVLDRFISDLTGITSRQIKNAPCLENALTHMIDWLGDREYKIYAWSDNDLSQLQKEIASKAIDKEEVAEFMNAERWVDYQAIFGKRFEFNRAVSLEEALMCCGIDTQGRLHDGLDDAINTANLIKTLEQDDEFVINQWEEDSTYSEPLNFSMGDLFVNLKIECIA